MKIVYKCEYCDEINENENEIKKHELKCGYNPKNQINDDIILKLSNRTVSPSSLKERLIDWQFPYPA